MPVRLKHLLACLSLMAAMAAMAASAGSARVPEDAASRPIVADARPEQAVRADRGGFEGAVEALNEDARRARRTAAEQQTAGGEFWIILAAMATVVLLITAPFGRLAGAQPRGARRSIAARQVTLAAIDPPSGATMPAALSVAAPPEALAEQHAQFEAALNNMAQGLCTFDASHRIVVHNRQFVAMFGAPEAGTHASAVLPQELLEHADVAAAGRSTSFTRTLEDGRVIAVALQPLPGGGTLATYDDITERHRAEARLMHMARHDALTGLPNRVLFRDHTEHALAQLARGAGLAVLCLDLDHFKAVNDTLGHPIGDALLMAVAQRLLGCTRESDLIVRLGGDEFALVQVGTGQPEQAKKLAERIIAALGAPFDIQGQDIAISTSIGIVVTTDARASSDELLKSADIALYKAKAEGRGTYRFFEAEMDARIQARRRLELDLRHALSEQQFEVHYQPYVSVKTGAVTGAEALVRWRHPTRGLVSPAEFIPVAEETGLIRPLGLWVLNQACADAMRWPDYVKVSVNLSPVQFRDRDLADKVADALDRSGLPAHRLELEITESLLLKESEAVLSILHEMRAHGVRIAMDDFGTGYSSLSYLRRFPFDKIKIDQSFVRNLTEREDCIAIVRAVIGLGRSLGMTVIAEGVETEAQFRVLSGEGCDQVQGYLFSAPQPMPAVSELIGRYVAAPAGAPVTPIALAVPAATVPA